MTNARAIGKIAGEPEFLRADSPLDEWIHAGFEAALERWGLEWRDVFRQGTAYAFLLGDLCGVLAPSRDSVGRDYPLAIFAPVGGGASPAIVLALSGFLESAFALLQDARNPHMTRDELRWQVEGLRVPRPEDVEAAHGDYLAWLRATEAREVWTSVLPSGHLEVQLTRGGGLMRVRLADGEPGVVALWLDVIRRSVGVPGAVFWSPDERLLTVCKGTPASLVATLWPREAVEWVVGTLGDVPASGSMAEFLTSLGTCS
jgi:type VI secretion system ImpM family protein